MSKNEVAKVEEGGVPAVFDFGDEAGAGFEGTTAKDLVLPFLGLLQSNSPQVENKDPAGAESGMLFNTVTRELFSGDDGILFLPCYKEGPVWVEWIPRNKGGGFVGMHEPGSDAVKFGQPIMHPETGKPTRKLRHGENELIETFYVYGLIVDERTLTTQGFAVISFTSSKITPYKKWTTALYTLRVDGPGGRRINPPFYANPTRVRTYKDHNNQGQTFFNYRLDPNGANWAEGVLSPADERARALMTDAKDLIEMIQSGLARAAFETQEATTGEAEVDAEGGSGGGDPEKPPF